MDNFKVIYKILRYLETCMDCEELDAEPIQPDALGLTKERWTGLMEMLINEGYIIGAEVKRHIRAAPMIMMDRPRITLKGLEYLQENSLMKKAADLARGVVDLIK